MGDFSIRFAAREDIPTILGFIRALAAYEKMEDQVIADETLLETWIFEKRKAEVLLAFEGDTPVGFALSSTIFRRGSAAPAFTSKISSCCPNTAAGDTASCC